jgi:hypothetical protein
MFNIQNNWTNFHEIWYRWEGPTSKLTDKFNFCSYESKINPYLHESQIEFNKSHQIVATETNEALSNRMSGPQIDARNRNQSGTKQATFDGHSPALLACRALSRPNCSPHWLCYTSPRHGTPSGGGRKRRPADMEQAAAVNRVKRRAHHFTDNDKSSVIIHMNSYNVNLNPKKEQSISNAVDLNSHFL